jgi:hypothetical protein
VILAEALDRLPPDYREVIVLRQWEELPFNEVARRMGRSVDSVQKLWIRGPGAAPARDGRSPLARRIPLPVRD